MFSYSHELDIYNNEISLYFTFLKNGLIWVDVYRIEGDFILLGGWYFHFYIKWGFLSDRMK